MVYGLYAIISIEIDTLSWCRSQFKPKVNESGLRYVIDLIDEIRDVAYIQEFAAKKRVTRRYNSKVMRR